MITTTAGQAWLDKVRAEVEQLLAQPEGESASPVAAPCFGEVGWWAAVKAGEVQCRGRSDA